MKRPIFWSTDTLRGVGRFPPGVYLLEFAGEDDQFAAAEARAAATELAVLASGIGTAATIDRERISGLAFTRRVSKLVGTAQDGIDALERNLEDAPIDRSGSVAVRARDVRGTAGIDSQAVEGRLGQVLVHRGFEVDLDDPEQTLLALFADEQAVLGWQVATTDRGYGDRAPTDRPFFQPGSMDPLLARAVANLARVTAGDVVLDPMCGTGGLLIEAGLLGADTIGLDAQEKMVRGARQNLQSALGGTPAVGQGDGTALPLRDDSVDAVVFDAPYGRQSKIASHGLEELIQGALAEAARVGSRAVLVADREYDELARAAGWTLEAKHERRVHRSLTRHVHVLA